MVALRSYLLCLLLILLPSSAFCSLPKDPISCSSDQAKSCTITNAYDAFPDRSICTAGEAVYPSTEKELLAAVAEGARQRRKMKVATRYSHSIPKLVCPGGDDGLLISTRFLNRVVSVDTSAMTVTVEAGIILKDVIEEAAAAGLALPYTPYWWGLSVGGLLSTGAHGSSLWGKGGAVHEYVVGVRMVTPASASEGYAKLRVLLDASHPYLDAAKVSLGVLGVISQVTLRLQPLFKRSITNSMHDDSELADRVLSFGREHEFADITWYPAQRKVVYRVDDRVSSNTSGSGGVNDFTGFRPTPVLVLRLNRLTEEGLEAKGKAAVKCLSSKLTTTTLMTGAYGLSNNGIAFTGYPVVGYQNKLQSSGSCLEGAFTVLGSCPWDPRAKGEFFHQTTISIGLPKVSSFIADVQKLRDLNPTAMCGLDLYNGILMRYVKASTAFLGKQEDAVDFDFTYYRSHDPTLPRLYEDALEEVEQMALFKYGGLPHWGKNRNVAFDGVPGKYTRMEDFMEVRRVFDPDGLFSSEWTDQILGRDGKPSIDRDKCALEGLCVCSDDNHCAPERSYFCRPGKVYTDARVCTRLNSK